jgi:hypothetical protein
MDVSSSKYDKKDWRHDKWRICAMIREIHVRVEGFLLVTQNSDWIIKCEPGIKRRSGMQDKVTICDRNRIWCFEDSSLLFLERGNEIMLWGSRILYDLCYAIMWASKICMYVEKEWERNYFWSSRISSWMEIWIMSYARWSARPLMSNLLNDHDTCYEDFELWFKNS